MSAPGLKVANWFLGVALGQTLKIRVKGGESEGLSAAGGLWMDLVDGDRPCEGSMKVKISKGRGCDCNISTGVARCVQSGSLIVSSCFLYGRSGEIPVRVRWARCS